MKLLRILDPLYGTLVFSEREAALIFSPEIQRLRYVRMCNINSLLITGASEISRFEHVIGVLYLSKEWTAANGIRGQDADVIHAAALLHDVQTGPFGHSLEYILEDNKVQGDFRHQDVGHGASRRYLQLVRANASFCGARFSASEQLGERWAEVALTISGGGAFGKIISDRIDLDNIDNVVRLAYHVGLATRVYATTSVQLVRDIRMTDGVISISGAGIPPLLRWQEIRRSLVTGGYYMTGLSFRPRPCSPS